jgi:PAS domain S-box-containing protein
LSSCSEHSASGSVRTSEKVSLEAQQVRGLMNDMPVMIWSTGPDGLSDFFNRSWLDFRGRALEEEIGFGWAQGVHPEDLACCMRARAFLFDQKQSFQAEYRILRHDSIYRWILDMGAPWRWPDGMFRGYIGVCIDIQERKQAEESLRNVNDALNLQTKELSEFTYAAGHDLLEPLRTVTCYTELLANTLGGSRDSGGTEIVPVILGSVQRMQALIRDILFYSHLVRGSKMTTIEVDCNSVLDQVLLACRATIEENQATVTRGHLPIVHADEGQLGRIFQNLISNAIKYRDRNRPPRIHISADDRGADWRFEVSDNGIGFDPQYSEYIFGLLKRLHGQSEYTGSGMGLAICKRIVERHGGRIWATSELGHGSRFFFTLSHRPFRRI